MLLCTLFYIPKTKKNPLCSWMGALLLAFVMLKPAWLWAQGFAQLLIPIHEKRVPFPRDLGLSPLELERLRAQGRDLSALEPTPNNLYRSPNPVPDPVFPAQSTLFQIVGLREESTQAVTRVLVTPGIGQPTYDAVLSLEGPSILMRHALLRALGYTVPAPQMFQRLQIKLGPTCGDVLQLNEILDAVEQGNNWPRNFWIEGGKETIATLDQRAKLCRGNPDEKIPPKDPETVLPGVKEKIIVLFGSILEPSESRVPRIHYGELNPENFSSYFAPLRSLRSVAVPISLMTLPQSINLFGFESIKKDNGFYVMSGGISQSYSQGLSADDALWIGKKICQLDRNQWQTIVAAGKYPDAITPTVLSRVLIRANRFCEVLNLNSPQFSIDIPQKWTQETFPNYPQRFSYGDPKNPLRFTEILKFLGVKSISQGLGAILGFAQSKLNQIGPQYWTQKHAIESFKKQLEFLRDNPGQTYVRPIQAFGGPTVGGGFTANRNIVTGTYYGNNSPIQLVDTFGVGVNLGAFVGISGLPFANISTLPRVTLNRTYVHVRPLGEMKDALQKNWDKLVVPHFAYRLTRGLNREKTDHTKNKIKDAQLDAAIFDLKVGESLIINDSLGVGNQLQATAPLGLLMGLPVQGLYLQGSVGHDLEHRLISRTTINRLDEGWEILTQSMNQGHNKVFYDVQFFLRLLRQAWTWQYGRADNQRYMVSNEHLKERATPTARALSQLIRWNDGSAINDIFEHTAIAHDAKSRVNRTHLGPWIFNRRETMHQVSVEGKDYEKRTVLQSRLTRIQGRDYIGFFSSVLSQFWSLFNVFKGRSPQTLPDSDLGQGLVQVSSLFGGQSPSLGDSPANQFLGVARTVSIDGQMEISPDRPRESFFTISESIQGWTVTRDKLLRILHRFQNSVFESTGRSVIIHDEDFAYTKRVQAYSIQWNLVFQDTALKKLFKLLDKRKTSAQEAYLALVQSLPYDEYFQYCQSVGATPGVKKSNDDHPEADHPSSWTETTQGQKTHIGCVMPWMKNILDFRRVYEHYPEAFIDSPLDRDQAAERLKAMTRFFDDKDSRRDIKHLLGFVGNFGATFQIQVAGFRTHDEAGDTTYFSHRYGETDDTESRGPLAQVAESSMISVQELEARYLSDGF